MNIIYGSMCIWEITKYFEFLHHTSNRLLRQWVWWKQDWLQWSRFEHLLNKKGNWSTHNNTIHYNFIALIKFIKSTSCLHLNQNKNLFCVLLVSQKLKFIDDIKQGMLSHFKVLQPSFIIILCNKKYQKSCCWP